MRVAAQLLGHLRRHAIAGVALVLALGGTAYAAKVVIPTKSVGTKQLKKKAVTNAKLANGAITGAKVKDGSLGAAELAPGTIPGPSVPDVLPSGKSLTGIYAVAGHKTDVGFVSETEISFAIRLGTSPGVVIRPVSAAPTADCPGTATEPAAAGGKLCIYQTGTFGGTTIDFAGFGTNRFGVLVFPTGVAADADYSFEGTWAVTAP